MIEYKRVATAACGVLAMMVGGGMAAVYSPSLMTRERTVQKYIELSTLLEEDPEETTLDSLKEIVPEENANKERIKQIRKYNQIIKQDDVQAFVRYGYNDKSKREAHFETWQAGIALFFLGMYPIAKSLPRREIIEKNLRQWFNP